MTTSPVMSITDELLAEIEAAASDSKLNIYRPLGWAHSVRCGNHLQTDFDFLSLASPETVLALTAHIVDLKQQVIAAGITAENCEVFRQAMDRTNVEAAAMKLAECMDYPWQHMPEQGRNEMRKHAQAVIDAAMDANP